MNKPNGSCIRGRRSAVALVLGASLLLVAAGCGENEDTGITSTGNGPAGSLVSTTGCKTHSAILSFYAGETPQECFQYEYSTRRLKIDHINLCLNCCPGTIEGTVTIEGDTIRIKGSEEEGSAPCRCLCLYDIEYEISDLDPGTWTILFEGDYVESPNEILVATVDLAEGAGGERCVPREGYPWDLQGEEPYGTLTGHGTCKEDLLSPEGGDSPVNEACAFYGYEGNILLIERTNLRLNCCQDMIYASIVFQGHDITITESEDPRGGLCDCVCFYDMYYTLRNVEPGVYTIRFVEPYLGQNEPPLEMTVDLTTIPSGEHCVLRY